MVGRLPAEPGRPRVGMAVGIDVVPPMDALGPTRTVDGLAVTPPPANCRPRVAAHDHRSRTMSEPAGPWRGRAGRLLAAGPTPKSRLGRGGGRREGAGGGGANVSESCRLRAVRTGVTWAFNC